MKLAKVNTLFGVFVGLSAAGHLRADTSLFITQSNGVVRLLDRNDDDDFLDFAENSLYAADFAAPAESIAWHQGSLFAVINQPPIILRIDDLNSDGDALDFAEVRTYAEFQPLAHALNHIVALTDGTLLCANVTGQSLIQFRDLNGDGDALDFDEFAPIASIDGSIRAVSIRPDGAILVAVSAESAPLRILQDINSDGDYYDFAENLSYAENLSPGVALQSPDNHVAYLSRATQSDIIRLHDRTRDNDALDFAECTSFATGLDGIGAIACSGQSLFAVKSTPASSLLAVRDLNGDSDALDFGEILEVATDLEIIVSIAVPTSNSECLLGDTNADGIVSPADIQNMANALVGIETDLELCRTDLNGDGQLNARDIAPFVAALIN